MQGNFIGGRLIAGDENGAPHLFNPAKGTQIAVQRLSETTR